jgi:nucleotide-binding universal stress UspA family protein
MTQFKKVLLPVDGSHHSDIAKRKAIGIATAMGAEIILMYATAQIPDFITGKPLEEAQKAQAKEAESVLKPYREELQSHNVTFIELVSSGSAGKEICKAAKKEGCDLVIMGSRGLGEFKGMLLGSVTSKVLAVCDIPVMVVR